MCSLYLTSFGVSALRTIETHDAKVQVYITNMVFGQKNTGSLVTSCVFYLQSQGSAYDSLL